jgi:capsular polysaccharide biosynthesis protein
MGGLYLYYLKKIRGEPVRVETAFSGFSHSLLHLILASFVTGVLTVLGFLCLILPGIFLCVAWLFTLPLVIDKRLDFWPAMRVSLKTISKHWWKFLGFLIILALVNLGGLLLCLVGVFITLPISFAALMYAYEDIVNPPGLPPVLPTGSGAPDAGSGVQPGVAALPHSLGPWLTVFLAGAVVILLLVFAALAGLTGKLIGYGLALAAGALALAIILRVRKSALPGGFMAPSLLVFALVFGAAVFITSILPESFTSTARVKLTPNLAAASQTPDSRSPSGTYDPYLIQTECEVMQSEEILSSVITALDLNQEWARRYGGGAPFKTPETMALLKSRLVLRPVRNTSLIAISVSGDRPEEAAQIANEIAQTYQNHNNSGSFQVEIVDRALPSLQASRPNKPLNFAIGAMFGLVLGTAAGAARVALHARIAGKRVAL